MKEFFGREADPNDILCKTKKKSYKAPSNDEYALYKDFLK